MTSNSPASTSNVAPDTISGPRIVAFDAPWLWLAAGWRDMWAYPAVSLCYGLMFTAAAAILIFGLLALNALPWFLALAGGFLLIGPLFAVGLYEASRRIGRGEPVSFWSVALAPARARGQLGFAGAALLIVFMVWLRVAFLLSMLFLGGSPIPPAADFTRFLLFTPEGLGLLVVGTMAGAGLAVLVFATSAISLPALLVKRTDVFTAATYSVKAVLKNPRPMALWAALIVAIMAAGFATLLFGLIIAFPLIGHATWHAFEDIAGASRE